MEPEYSQQPINPMQGFPFGTCPTHYFNGFSLAVGAGDMVIALQLNGQPSMILNASYTTAKTLAEALNEAISQLEEKTNTTIMTTQDVANALGPQ